MIEDNQNISSRENEEKLEDQNFAFFDPKRPEKEVDKKIEKTKNNYVGLLLPLTGEKRSYRFISS